MWLIYKWADEIPIPPVENIAWVHVLKPKMLIKILLQSRKNKANIKKSCFINPQREDFINSFRIQ